MKIKYERVLKDGRIHVLLELDQTEAFPVQPVNDEAFYRLGYPIADIVPGHVIAAAQRVHWCAIEQKWVDV